MNEVDNSLELITLLFYISLISYIIFAMTAWLLNHILGILVLVAAGAMEFIVGTKIYKKVRK